MSLNPECALGLGEVLILKVMCLVRQIKRPDNYLPEKDLRVMLMESCCVREALEDEKVACLYTKDYTNISGVRRQKILLNM